MADDIDIEEHDLMENPKIRSMFPDLSILKEEILDPYDPENKYQDSLQIRKEYGSINPSFMVTKTEPLLNEDDSTPNISIQSIPKDKSTNCEVFKTKIILGSKPNRNKEFDEKLKSKVKVCLKNISGYLAQSTRYCEVCHILFSNKQSFKDHLCLKQSLQHEQIIVKNNSKKDKPRHFNKIENANIMVNINSKNYQSQEGESLNKCFHCSVLFPSQKSLIDHLYDILETKTTSTSKKMKDKIVANLNNVNCDNKQSKKTECPNENRITNLDNVNCNNNKSKKADVMLPNLDNVNCNNNNEPASIINSNDAEYVYQCHICSYYFKQKKFYEIHLLKKHGLKDINSKPKVIFDAKCKYCLFEYINLKYYNLHMIKKHNDIVTKRVGKYNEINSDSSSSQENSSDEFEIDRNLSVETPSNAFVSNQSRKVIKPKADSFLNVGNFLIFKSIIFKCLQCHLHFLSSDVAINHEEHNQMLINWKCPKCLKFFKRNDEKLHSEQHLLSTSFIVYELSEADSGKVLIKCPKCTINFNESDFVRHNSLCGNVQMDSTYCSYCDVLVNDEIIKLHKFKHINKKMLASDFIFIDFSKQEITTNIYNKNVTKRKKQQNKYTQPSKRIKTILDDVSSSDSDSIPLADVKQRNSKPMKCVADGIDNCFDESLSAVSNQNNYNITKDLSRSESPSVIVENSEKFRRKVSKKITSEANNKKINYKHKCQLGLLHLTYCDFCECFITTRYHVKFHLKARCKDIQKRVCKICGVVVTGKASTSHKAFHKINPNLTLKDFTFYDINTNKTICPPLPKYPKCDICDIHFTSKTDILGHVCSKDNFMQCHICNIKLTDKAYELHIPFHSYSLEKKRSKTEVDEKTSLVTKETIDELVSKDSELIENNEIISEPKVSVDKGVNFIIFSCKNCNLSVSTYDDLIKHCHFHYVKSEVDQNTKECEICSLKFEDNSYEYHQELHSQSIPKEAFKVIYIDMFYFGCSQEEWVKYVFESLSKEQEAEVLENSIYKRECRIKMEITQEGHWGLTMYRCEKCRCFIDNIYVYKHVQNCVGKYNINPCKFCGINFISFATRNEHEKNVHKQIGITLKSYRIVSFNRKEDKIWNDTIANKNKYYILYKCRNCNGVVDSNKILNHQCYLENLEKCKYCGLLLYEAKYDQHVSKHKQLDSFKESNIKVILVGKKSVEIPKNKTECSFSGILCDYIFYRCVKCEVCVRSVRPSSKHFCLIDAAKLKCQKCLLFFDEGKLKNHLKQHSTDPDFVKDNMLVVDFDPEDPTKCLEYEENESAELKNKSETKDVAKTIIEKTDTIYKCACGLHHLTKSSYKEHSYRLCDIKKKVNKQTCFKCGLDFTPNVLFKHLLIHHGDINVVYKLEVIEA